MRKSLIFTILALALLAPWPVAYAHENNVSGAGPVRIEPVPPASEAAPRSNVLHGGIGGVSGGDLFYIDSLGSGVDMTVALHITNTDELVSAYRYMTLKTGVYVLDGEGQWQPATQGNGGALPDTYITMSNGMVEFRGLAGYARYKVTIDRGCFYSYGSAYGGGAAAPVFYLSVE